MLRAYGLPESDVCFLERLYQGSRFAVAGPYGQFAQIHTHAGVNQGDITSPLLWNLIVNVLLRYLHGARKGYVHSSGVMTSALAYIDDAVIFAQSQSGFKTLLHRLNRFYKWAGLKINNAKCAIFAHDYNTGKSLATDHHHINGRPIPAITVHQTYKYLGLEMAPGGSWAVEKQRVKARMQECISALRGSPYLPHQLDQVVRACLFPIFRYGAALVNWTDHELDLITNKWAQARRLAEGFFLPELLS